MRAALLIAAALAATLPAGGGTATAQAQPQALDAKAAIAAVRKAVAENYVVAGRRAALDAVLAEGLASGRYAVSDPAELSRRVTEDLFAVANDKHLGLHFDPRTAEQLGNRPQNDEIQDSAFFRDQARRANHGVARLELLPGNIRLLQYDGFLWTGAESQAAIDNAAAFLRGGDAIVIDIRGNGGGSPDAVRRLASYFVPAGAKLVTFHMRSDPPTVFSAEEVPGGLIRDVPVYVLTSGQTASAAEEFSSHVKGHKFGTLVGETTAGAGYRNEHFAIPGGFVLSVSVGRPELPDGSDWEARGVAPAIAVKPEQAFARAQQAALETLAASAQGLRRTELEWAAAQLGARAVPAALARPAEAYAGRYGPRTIAVQSGALVYHRDGGISTALLPIGPDLFAMDADAGARVRFTLTGGAVTGFVLERIDGSRVEQPRD